MRTSSKTRNGLAAIATLIATPVFAADMPVKAPPLAPAPAPSWAGFYAGAQVGAAWTRDALTETSAFTPPQTGNATENAVSFIGGGHAGYNWQMGDFVFGPEVDIEGTTLKTTDTCLVEDAGAGNPTPGACFAGTHDFSTQIFWQASVRGRIGYAWQNALIYATGGVAFADIETTYTQTVGATVASESFRRIKTGFTVGGGVDYALDAHWIARLEYRYTDFGTVSDANSAAAGAFWVGYTNDHAITEHAVRVGVSYLFGAW